MPIVPPQQRPDVRRDRTDVRQAEAALVEHYPHLVRLAYVVLPPGLGRHRRVLAAHAVVQRALPAVGGGAPTARVPAQSRRSRPTGEATGTDSGTGTDTGTAYGWMRLRVLRTALAYERRPRWWPGRLPAPAALRPTVPVVWGLRLFPRAGGVDELALDRALSRVDGAARAAFALQVLEGLDASAVRDLLARAAVDDPADAVRRAAGLGSPDRDGARAMLGSGEFDPCTVQTRPSDLLRRRQRVRAAAVAAALCVLAGGLAVAVEESTRATGADRSPAGALAPVLDPAELLRTAAEQWADTSRVDFTAWPARGGRTSDTELLGRALRAWAEPPGSVRVSATPGTGTVPPVEPPRLLFAGEVDGAAVVLFHDSADRVVRYAEPLSGTGGAALDFARTDDADVTTGGAVVIGRTADGARFLLAPWIAESTTRDLLAPDTPSRPLAVGRDGVTAAVPRPALGGACDAWPVLQLRSSERIVEKHAFLVTDLGDLAPVHLTYTPKPGRGAPARQPREATGPEALLVWARTACSLRTLSAAGVRSVNNWAFAEQKLPEGGGPADWLCTRAETWRGPGRALVQFLPAAASPTEPATVVADRGDTALCGRFGQHVLAGTHWKAPSGRWYVLAAGSRAVTRIEAKGAVRGAVDGTAFAVRAPRDAEVELTAAVRGGGTLPAVY
ncbi:MULTISPECIES: hypothetical protein [Streptomyces]|uniref:hypothetical protein n=1 Tax=Streptomyces TaxID=1883 RepID=UPI0005B87BB5|nr:MULTISPECIES: hypothetical protein [Streptomyces]